jgi:group II intron reverse transcriptase/maturase
MNLIKQVLSHDNMRAAWEEVAQKKGAAGVDGVTIKRWRRNWEENLYTLAGSVWANTYKPASYRTFKLPKKSGGYRTISVLTVNDRVLQRAVLRIVDDFFDMGFFNCSYGYRQGRGLRDAIAHIIALRDSGYRNVLDADIDDCFNNLDHNLIKHYFRQTVSDPILNRLVGQWLRAGVKSPGDTRGICMGGVISPLFCNLVLHQLDRAVSLMGWRIVRYADDFCIFCETAKETQQAFIASENILAKLGLHFEPNKTRLTDFEEGFSFLGVTFLGDEYSFDSNMKHIIIKGPFDGSLFENYIPEGYD